MYWSSEYEAILAFSDALAQSAGSICSAVASQVNVMTASAVLLSGLLNLAACCVRIITAVYACQGAADYRHADVPVFRAARNGRLSSLPSTSLQSLPLEKSVANAMSLFRS